MTLLLAISPLIARSAEPVPSDHSAATEIDRILAESFLPDAPGAAVLVVRNDEVLLRKGYGLADLELGVPIDPAQIFRLGSITKQFTAVAILQLVEAGKIRLDDEITMYVPDCPTIGTKVTLSHLLTHTSGIPNYTERPDWLNSARQDLTVAQLFAFTKDKPFEFTPGTDWKYSNTNYILLGAVIEKVSGQNYADYLQTHIFAPAGMTHSCYDSTERIIPGRIPGYSRAGKNKEWTNARYISMTQPFSAGALLSNVDDLWKWEQALDAGQLLSPASLEIARSQAHLADGRGTGYGFGWRIGAVSGHPTFEHAGSIPGFVSYKLRAKDAGLYAAILCNADAPVAQSSRLAVRIAKLLLGKPNVVEVKVPDSVLQDCVGVYRTTGDEKFALTIENGKLFGQETGRDRHAVIPLSANEFQIPTTDLRFSALRDAKQHVDRLRAAYGRPSPERFWPRIDEPFEDTTPTSQDTQKASK
jgi:CubicO group peptidase (beta-lactamase class C family)